MELSTATLRVNKLKELLVYTNLNEEEICREIGYPSIQAMNEELWNLTGLKVSFYKELKASKENLQNRQYHNI
jgi:hypothetical protein